jgi:hypothetical protein
VVPLKTPLKVLVAVSAAMLVSAPAALAQTPIVNDPLAGGGSQHMTAVEPDTYAFGATIVAATQVGRFFDGGSSGIGFATTTNNGASWTSGLLPGITTAAAGPYDRATDPSVAYDERHKVWMVSTLALTNTASGPTGSAVLTSRSTDGGAVWAAPVTTAKAAKRQDFDKNWIACDNTPTSPYYGSCYTQWDDFGSGNALKMAYSRDGGLTWSQSNVPRVGVIGGQPLALPNGDVVVPLDNANSTALGYSISKNGGAKFSTAKSITSIPSKVDPGNLRSGPLPSAEIGGGKIFVVWEDCRFRTNCSTNDLVYTTTTDGTTWTAVQRIPIDPVTSSVDHFLPGVAVSANGATVSVTYYFYPDVSCTAATCQLEVGHISSTNGGASWGAPVTVVGPMTLSWLPDTSQGRMVGDYISSSFGSDGNAHPAFAAASPPSGSVFNQPLYTATLTPVGGSVTSAANPVVFNAPAANGSAPFKRR